MKYDDIVAFYDRSAEPAAHPNFILWHDEIIRDENGREIPKIKPMPSFPFPLDTAPVSEALDRVKAGIRDHESKVPEQTREAQTAAGAVMRHVPRPLPTPETRQGRPAQSVALPDVELPGRITGYVANESEFVVYGNATNPERSFDGREAGRWADDGGGLGPGVLGEPPRWWDHREAIEASIKAKRIQPSRLIGGPIGATSGPGLRGAAPGEQATADGAIEGVERVAATSPRILDLLARACVHND